MSTPTSWMLRLLVFTGLLSAVWMAGSWLGSSRTQRWPGRGDRIRVLATLFPLYDFARNVGGDAVEVRSLLPPGADPHEFALAPRDVQLAAGADLLVANGLGLDEFLARAVGLAGGSRAPLVEAAAGLPTLAVHDDHRHGEAGHAHGGGDPHLWLDPLLARRMVSRIARAIAAEAGARWGEELARGVRLRSVAYGEALQALHEEFRRELAPARGRPFIAFHGAYAYLARRYGLNVAAVWQTTPGREPSPREVGRLLETARRLRVTALFSEPRFSTRALEMIASDARLPVFTLDPIETAEHYESGSYLGAMRRNLAVLRQALAGPAP